MAGIMEMVPTNPVSLQAVILVLLSSSDYKLCKRWLMAAEPKLLGSRAASLAKGSEA